MKEQGLRQMTEQVTDEFPVILFNSFKGIPASILSLIQEPVYSKYWSMRLKPSSLHLLYCGLKPKLVLQHCKVCQ